MFDEQGNDLGIGGFIAVRDEAKGLRLARRERTMGLRGMPEGELVFEDLEIPAGMAVLPPSGFRRGFADLMTAYNSQRVGAGTVAMGIAAGALDLAVDWVKSASSSAARSANSRACNGCSPTCRPSSRRRG